MNTINSTALYLRAIEFGHVPSNTELAQLCTALHISTLNTPLMLWLDHSFEDQSDSVYRAIECARVSESQLEYYNSLEQNLAREHEGAL